MTTNEIPARQQRHQKITAYCLTQLMGTAASAWPIGWSRGRCP
jgi:hypothetical protein